MQINPLQLFKCLSDDTRLQIILLVQSQGELCVGELVEALGSSQPKVSRHLASLRDCQLLDIRKSGQWVFYRVHDELPKWANEIICQAVLAGETTLKELTAKLNLVNEPHRKLACC
ncbi:MAG: ArsR family transcriptional regulator [Crocinitomicaceae bacterium]|jgi:ArsR family transcriptional regulator